MATIVAGAEADEPLGEAYTELIEFMRDNCGFSVLAFNHRRHLLQRRAGPRFQRARSIFTVDNTSDVEQAILIARINDDVTEPATELARLPAAEAFERIVVQSSLGVAPGATAYAHGRARPGPLFRRRHPARRHDPWRKHHDVAIDCGQRSDNRRADRRDVRHR